MKARRSDLIMRAVTAQAKTIRRALARWNLGADDAADIEQLTIWKAYNAAKDKRVEWRDADRLRSFLRVIAFRTAAEWLRTRGPLVELQEWHEPTIPANEGAAMAGSVLRLLQASTTPERWRAVRFFAMGFKVAHIAQREGVPVPTIYTRMRLAREDFAAAIAREEAIIAGPFVRRKRR